MVYFFFHIKLTNLKGHYEISLYESPELFECSLNNKKIKTFDPFRSDIYSIGAILFEILYGDKAIQ